MEEKETIYITKQIKVVYHKQRYHSQENFLLVYLKNAQLLSFNSTQTATAL